MRGDLEWRTIPNLAHAAAERAPDAEAIVDGDRRVTNAELVTGADRAAAAFIAAGVETGDRVAIWAPNCAEWVVALIGLQSAGATLVPLNTRFKGAEAAQILNRSRAKVLLTVNGFLGNNYVDLLATEDTPTVETTVVLKGEPPTPSQAHGWDDFLASGDGVDRTVVTERRDGLGPDDISDLIFTSGTTGAPKGVICTHAQSLRGSWEWADISGLREGDRYLLVNPMFHSFGYKAGILPALEMGATLVPVPTFDVDTVFDLIATERITVFPGAPTLYQTLLNHPRLATADLSSLRLAVTGAASIPTELVRRMHDELGFETVVTAYGLTEASGFVSTCRRGDDIDVIANTSGRAYPGVDVRVVDDDGKELGPGDPGEIVCRGWNVMQGYFEDPEQTAETIDADGWLHTGDIGTMDEHGNIKITDRKKDMFIIGGFNAYPAEIENLLLAHPDIAQAAVVGIPDERQGEVGAAFVVPTSGSAPDPDEIVAWAREHMANYKAPRQVVVVDALPVNAAGKVLKYELRDRLVRD